MPDASGRVVLGCVFGAANQHNSLLSLLPVAFLVSKSTFSCCVVPEYPCSPI